MPLLDVVASSPAIIILVPDTLVSIPSPPDTPKSAEPAVSEATFSSSAINVTPVISPECVSESVAEVIPVTCPYVSSVISCINVLPELFTLA